MKLANMQGADDEDEALDLDFLAAPVDTDDVKKRVEEAKKRVDEIVVDKASGRGNRMD